MTQQDDWQQGMARLAQRHNQLERQHRETTTRVDTLKRDVDSRIDSLRREMDWQFRDREWRVKSLERFRDFIESLIIHAIMIGCAVALVVSLVIILVEVRGARQEGERTARGAFTLFNEAHQGQPGEQAQPSIPPMGHISTAPVAQHASVIDTSGNPDSCLCGVCFNIGPGRGFVRPVAERPNGPAALPGLVVRQKPRRRDSRSYSTGLLPVGGPRPSHSSQFPGPPPAGHGYRIGSKASGESSTSHFLGPMRTSQSHLALISEVPPLARDPGNRADPKPG